MKKRMLSLALAALMLALAAIPLTASAYSTEFYVYTQNGKTLNMRSEMKTGTNNVVASIPYGAEVDVHEFIGSKWARVSYKNQMGYVMSRYLVAQPPAPFKPTPTPTVKKPTATPAPKDGVKLDFSGFKAVTKRVVTVRPSAPGGFVNLRWAPSKSLAVIKRLPDGQQLEVIAQDTTWAQVRVVGADTVGFIMRSFLNDTSGVQ